MGVSTMHGRRRMNIKPRSGGGERGIRVYHATPHLRSYYGGKEREKEGEYNEWMNGMEKKKELTAAISERWGSSSEGSPSNLWNFEVMGLFE